MKLFTFLLCLFFAGKSIAQPTTFQFTTDFSSNDFVTDVVENTAGDYVAVCNTYIGSKYDITLLKISQSGAVISTHTIGNATNEFAKSICHTSDGGYFITGYSYTNINDNNALLIKVDSAFNIQFYKTLGTATGNDYANEGFEASPGLYTFTGTVALGGSAKPSIVTVNDSGYVISEHYLNTNQFASPEYKGTYLGNGKIGFAHLSNIISVLDTGGNIIEDFAYSSGGFSTDAIATADGKVVAIGVGNIGGPQGSTVFICKGDTVSGSLSLLQKYAYTSYSLEAEGIVQDSAGNYFLAVNRIDFGSGMSAPLIIKTDSSGQVIRSYNYRPVSSNHSEFKCIIHTSDGGFLAAGNAMLSGNTDLFFVKTDVDGISACNSNAVSVTNSNFPINATNPHSPFSGNLNTFVSVDPTNVPEIYTSDLICISTDIPKSSVKSGEGFNIFPTVFEETISITCNRPEIKAQARISDMTGRLVFTKEFSGNSSLDLSDLSRGQYIIVIESADKEYYLRENILKAN
jgi:hypothetical protein